MGTMADNLSPLQQPHPHSDRYRNEKEKKSVVRLTCFRRPHRHEHHRIPFDETDAITDIEHVQLQAGTVPQGVQTQAVAHVRRGGGMYLGEDDTFQGVYPYQGGERQGVLYGDGPYPFCHRGDG